MIHGAAQSFNYFVPNNSTYGYASVWPSSGTNNRQVAEPSGTRDKCLKSGTVPEIPGQLAVADPEGFHRFPLKPPLLGNVYNNNIHLQQRYTAILDSKEISLPCFKFVY